MKVSANTLVKNGMPFIGKVLRQVVPFVDEMVICVSENSTDGTMEEIKASLKEWWDKVVLMTENVKDPGELTEVQNEMLRKSRGEWILFLSDDDYWPEDQLKLCLDTLGTEPDILAYSVNPYQLLDWEHYDSLWGMKFFSKFFKREGTLYLKPWPAELPSDKDGNALYWRTHPKVKRLPHRFYHLSYLKNHSFRDEQWAKGRWGFRDKGDPIPLGKPLVI